MADYFGAADSLLGGLGSFFSGQAGAKGFRASARAYRQAAQFSQESAAITERSTAIQQSQATRQLYGVLSGQQADIAGAGLKNAGSAQYLLRSTAEQIGVTHALIGNQGLITELGFQREAAAEIGQANQAAAQAKGSGKGGFLGAVGGVVGAVGKII